MELLRSQIETNAFVSGLSEYQTEKVHYTYGRNKAFTLSYGSLVNVSHFPEFVPFLKEQIVKNGIPYNEELFNLFIQSAFTKTLSEDETTELYDRKDLNYEYKEKEITTVMQLFDWWFYAYNHSFDYFVKTIITSKGLKVQPLYCCWMDDDNDYAFKAPNLFIGQFVFPFISPFIREHKYTDVLNLTPFEKEKYEEPYYLAFTKYVDELLYSIENIDNMLSLENYTEVKDTLIPALDAHYKKLIQETTETLSNIGIKNGKWMMIPESCHTCS